MLDLGIYVSSNGSFEFHFTNLNKRTKHLPGWILITFSSLDKFTMLNLLKALVMYVSTGLWFPVVVPYLTKPINMIEQTQRYFTRYISGMQDLSYPERLTVLKLYSPQHRIERTDSRGRACITSHIGVGTLGTFAYNNFRWRVISMFSQLPLFLRNTTVCSVYSCIKK